MPADQLNLDAFMAQAMEYEAWDDPTDRVRRFFHEIGQDHPYAVRRVSEVMKWVQSGEYDRISPRRVPPPRRPGADVREEASDAVEFYAERFRTIFGEVGDNLTKAGYQVGGVADQVADWIRTRPGRAAGRRRTATPTTTRADASAVRRRGRAIVPARAASLCHHRSSTELVDVCMPPLQNRRQLRSTQSRHRRIAMRDDEGDLRVARIEHMERVRRAPAPRRDTSEADRRGGGAGWGGRPRRPFGGGRGRRRRGDVRTALLLLLAEEPRNGYQLMQTIEERSGGRWRPSPGSVYPTLAQLEDEGLIRAIERDGAKLFEITDAGPRAARRVARRSSAAVGGWQDDPARQLALARSASLVIQIGKAAMAGGPGGRRAPDPSTPARRWPRRAGRCTGSSPRTRASDGRREVTDA